MEIKFYSFYINNGENKIWDVQSFSESVNLSYFKIKNLVQQGWTYHNLYQDPGIDLLEGIKLPLYSPPNSIIIDWNFKNSNQQNSYGWYKSLIIEYFRNNALNFLFE